MRVKRALDGAHHIDGAVAGFGHQKIHLVQTHAVLASASAFERQCPAHQLVVQLFRNAAFFRNVGVDQVAEVKVAVAYVANQKVRNVGRVDLGDGVQQAIGQA